MFTVHGRSDCLGKMNGIGSEKKQFAQCNIDTLIPSTGIKFLFVLLYAIFLF